jgi:hypothetical protein
LNEHTENPYPLYDPRHHEWARGQFRAMLSWMGRSRCQEQGVIAANLDLAAAQAKVLVADKVRRGQNWPGDIRQGISQIISAAQDALTAAGDDR